MRTDWHVCTEFLKVHKSCLLRDVYKLNSQMQLPRYIIDTVLYQLKTMYF